MATIQASYRPMIHRYAQAELQDVPGDERKLLKKKVKQISLNAHPSEHPACKPLDGHKGLYRVRQGQYRAIVEKHLNELRILVVDHRATVYGHIEDAKRRGGA